MKMLVVCELKDWRLFYSLLFCCAMIVDGGKVKLFDVLNFFCWTVEEGNSAENDEKLLFLMIIDYSELVIIHRLK